MVPIGVFKTGAATILKLSIGWNERLFTDYPSTLYFLSLLIRIDNNPMPVH
jgi:hypothetical protein